MKIERNTLPKSIIELIIEEEANAIAKHRKKALSYLESNADIKWFRKWASIPEKVLISNYWEEYIARLTIDYAIDDMYKNAVKKEKIIPVAQAEIKDIISESPLKIKIHIEILPEVTIDKKYKDIKLKRQKVKVDPSEVENSIKEIENKFTKYEEQNWEDLVIENWDKVTIDTDWYEKDKILESTSMRDYPIIIWSKVLVVWFEDWLIWKKLWEEVELDITFPKDYHNKDFAGKKTLFKVKIKKIEKAVKPEFTPEFIEKLRWQKLDLEWFKDLIKKEITDTKEANARMEDELKLIEELMKVTKLDLWEWLIKNQIEKVYGEIKENMSQSWVKPADYLESLKMSEEDYKEKNVRPTAIKRLEWELVLHKLWEMEKMEISEEEMKTEIEKILSGFQAPDVLKRLKELYIPWTKYYEELKQRVWYRKLIDSFFE